MRLPAANELIVTAKAILRVSISFAQKRLHLILFIGGLLDQFCRVQNVVCRKWAVHYTDVIMGTMVSQIASLSIVYSTVYTGADQRKHQSPVSLAFFAGNSPGTDGFPAQRASNAKNVSIWWRRHGILKPACNVFLWLSILVKKNIQKGFLNIEQGKLGTMRQVSN